MNKIMITLFIVVLLGCSRNPVTGKKEFSLMSESQEISMGKSYDPQIVEQYGLYENAAMQNFINAKGKEMAALSHRPNLPYEFKILDSPVVNAFAVPGGYVYFTRGIMAHFNNEAEFAGCWDMKSDILPPNTRKATNDPTSDTNSFYWRDYCV
jgi:predicted Zn-dependent protease